ncbi:MAG: DUF1573 domain-containing protein [Sedimentisphaerales bacterium]|nr:DUF1573 domain-containing protein [Sedimentisphaerales bacterium]
MAGKRTGKWPVAGRQQLSWVALTAFLACGVLLLQVGCQQQAGDAKAPAAQVEPVQATARAPVASESQPAQAVSQSGQAQPQSGAEPKIEVKTAEQDFGEIGPETSHTTQFEFKNVGNAPLKILRVRACCGSVTRGVKAGQQFAPGESGALEVEYHTGNYPGPLTRRLSIDTNDPDQPTTNFTIKAAVVYRIGHSPSRVNLFPRKENAGCSPITLKSTDGKPFSIVSFRATANTLTADFDPNVKATEFVITPKANVDRLTRNPKGQISISLTHPECKNVLIPYDVFPEFSVTPPQFTLFNVKANQPIQRDLWILSNYEEDFEIESVTSQKGTMKIIESKKIPGTENNLAGASAGVGRAGARYQLRVQITPPVVQGERSILADILEIKIKGGETLTVQCRGFYAAS